MLAWGSAPGIRLSPDNQALKARLNLAWLLNPKRTAQRNQRRAREATRGECCALGARQMFLRSPTAFREDQARLHHVNSDLGDAVPILRLTRPC